MTADGCGPPFPHPCEAKANLTPGRRKALDILVRERRAIGAYELIALMKSESGRTLAPTQIYRALDYLVEHGLAHRLVSRNAFMACAHTHEARAAVAFLICETCGKVEEATCPRLEKELQALAREKSFAARAQTIEVAGLCSACAD